MKKAKKEIARHAKNHMRPLLIYDDFSTATFAKLDDNLVTWVDILSKLL